MAKPACIKKTKNAAKRVQTVSIATALLAAVGPASLAIALPGRLNSSKITKKTNTCLLNIKHLSFFN
jgi:hypothetical protein